MNDPHHLYFLFYLFLIYSALGWICEVAFAFCVKKRFVNRGFLHGPFCPIYGFGAVALHVFLTFLGRKFPGFPSQDFLALFICVFVITSAIEYLTGYVLEKIFHTKWWDYSEEKWNINGYICLKFSVLWGLAGAIVLKSLHIGITGAIGAISPKPGFVFMILMLLYFAFDTTFTVKQMVDFRRLITELEDISEQMKERLSEQLKENLEEFKEEFMEKLEDAKQDMQEATEEWKKKAGFAIREISQRKNRLAESLQESYQNRLVALSKSRLFCAFPDMKSIRHKKIIEGIRNIYLDRMK